MPRRLNPEGGFQKAEFIAKKSSKTLEGIPSHLQQALEVCCKCDRLIKSEIEPLQARKLTVEAHLREYIDYQIYLIEEQLTRAATEARRRLELIKSLDTVQKREDELKRCTPIMEGTLHWFNNWAWTVDPREDCSIAIIPLKPFEFQEDLIKWLESIVFIERTCGLLEKTRDMTASWTTVLWAYKHWRFREYFEALFGSRKEELVDNIGDQKSLFEKFRFQIRMSPIWMLPEGFDWSRDVNFCKILNPASGSAVTGESSNAEFARGGRPTVVFFDEFAMFPREGREAWGAASQSSRSRIPVSTPKGRTNQFSDIRHKDEYKIPIFTLHWKRHPWKTDVWYRNEARTMSREMIAQELDIDYDASQPGQILPDYRELVHCITWEQFADFFGDTAFDNNETPKIPDHWTLGMAMDVGYTTQHKWCLGWMARPAEGDPLRDCVFVYRSMVAPVGATVRQVAQMIRKAEAPWREHQRMSMRLTGHEAASQGVINTMNKEHSIPFDSWNAKEGYNFGIPQLKNFFEVRVNSRHPFKTNVPGLNASRIYLITHHSATYYNQANDKYEVYGAKHNCIEHPFIDCDHEELRMEIPSYHYPATEEGKPVQDMRPFKGKDDAIDWLRGLATVFFPQSTPLGDRAKREDRLAKNLRKSYIDEVKDVEYKNRLLMTREFALDELKETESERENQDDWRNSIWKPVKSF